jgi:hypothetical protein
MSFFDDFAMQFTDHVDDNVEHRASLSCQMIVAS